MNLQLFVALLLSFLCFSQAYLGYHVTPPRHVTVWTRFGWQFPTVSEPGIRLRNIFTTTAWDILVEEQIDKYEVKVGSKDGIEFLWNIEVSNILPKDMVHHVFARYGADYDELLIEKWVEFHMGQMCSQMLAEEIYISEYEKIDDLLKEGLIMSQNEEKDAQGNVVREPTGIIILKVKMTKPTCIASTFCDDTKKRAESAAKEKALKADSHRIQAEKANIRSKLEGELLREEDSQRATLNRERMIQEAESYKLKIQLQMRIDEADVQANITIKNAQASASATRIKAGAEKERLTPAFLTWEWSQAFFSSPNTKYYFGEKVPSTTFFPMNVTN